MTTVETFAAACYIASKAHEGQKDLAGVDYVLHLYRIADNFSDYTLKTVAILHDILEDTWVTEDLLRKLFPKEICDAVVALTRGINESYQEYIRRLSCNYFARKVKIEDLADNLDLSRLPEITDEDLNRAKKYAKWRNWLIDADLPY